MGHRPLKVAGVIQRSLAVILQSEIPDSNAWKVNITKVVLSGDLRFARVYFNSLDGEPGRAAAEECLAGHKGAIKHALAKYLRIKYQPNLQFTWDETLQVAEDVEALLDQLKDERNET